MVQPDWPEYSFFLPSRFSLARFGKDQALDCKTKDFLKLFLVLAVLTAVLVSMWLDRWQVIAAIFGFAPVLFLLVVNLGNKRWTPSETKKSPILTLSKRFSIG